MRTDQKWATFETLEPRMLLSAVLDSPIDDISVFENSDDVTIRLSNHFELTENNHSIVTFSTVLGDVNVELFDNMAPQTVENFLNYANADAWDGSFIHRSMPGFVIQGGGFVWDHSAGAPVAIGANPPVPNEFSYSNLRGTIAMAKLGGDPDSATNQWFFNLADNSQNLDNQNGGFTVFGQVIDSGMTIVDAIADLQRVNAGSPFDNLPLFDWDGVSNLDDSNLVMINDVRVVSLADSLTYTIIANDNTSLVSASIINGQLTLDITDDMTGQAEIQIQAENTNDGSIAIDTFTITVNEETPAIYVVDSLLDVVADDGLVTLREAIEAANTNSPITADVPAGSVGKTDIITFDESLAGGTIILDYHELTITGNLDIQGLGSNQLTIDGVEDSRVFEITSGLKVNIDGLTITGGSDNLGGGIYNQTSQLSLNDCIITGNTSTSNTYNHGGGGIYNEAGNLTITNSTVSGNSVTNKNGGGIYNSAGTLTITQSTFYDNVSQYHGGGIFLTQYSTLTVTDSTFIDNMAIRDEGGGIFSDYNCTLTLSGCDFNGNFAKYLGAAIYSNSTTSLSDSTITANNGQAIFVANGLTISGSNVSDNNGLGIHCEGPLVASNLIVSNNQPETDINSGGGIIYYGNSLTMDNCIITNNIADYEGAGLCIYGSEDTIATVTDSTFSNNQTIMQSGGALSIDGGHVTIDHCEITGNSAYEYGGGIYNRSVHSLTVKNVNISNNHARYDGGGFYNAYGIDTGTVVIEDSIIAGNTVNNSGGGVASQHGEIQLINTTVQDNYAAINGGGIYNCDNSIMTLSGSIIDNNIASINGGGISNQYSSSISINQSQITNNKSRYGGAIHVYDAAMIIDQSTLSDNIAFHDGGGIAFTGEYFHQSKSEVLSTLITSNSAGNYGGGISINVSGNDFGFSLTNSTASNNNASEGGGIYFNDDHSWKQTTLTNSTIACNTADIGGGICISPNDDMYGDTTLYLHNTVVADNTAFFFNDDIDGIDYFNINSFIGTIDGDPMLEPVTNDNDDIICYQPHADSPLVNAGNNSLAVDFDSNPLTVDQLNNQRIDDETVDIGAVEFQSPPEADFNNDGQVGLLDLDILGQNWGTNNTNKSQGDANGDGKVSLLDLDILGRTWGMGAISLEESPTTTPNPYLTLNAASPTNPTASFHTLDNLLADDNEDTTPLLLF